MVLNQYNMGIINVLEVLIMSKEVKESLEKRIQELAQELEIIKEQQEILRDKNLQLNARATQIVGAIHEFKQLIERLPAEEAPQEEPKKEEKKSKKKTKSS